MLKCTTCKHLAVEVERMKSDVHIVKQLLVRNVAKVDSLRDRIILMEDR